MFVNLHKNVNKCLFKHNCTPKLCTTLKWCIITVLALGEIYIFSKKRRRERGMLTNPIASNRSTTKWISPLGKKRTHREGVVVPLYTPVP